VEGKKCGLERLLGRKTMEVKILKTPRTSAGRNRLWMVATMLDVVRSNIIEHPRQRETSARTAGASRRCGARRAVELNEKRKAVGDLQLRS
jgi:hypothetical protein